MSVFNLVVIRPRAVNSNVDKSARTFFSKGKHHELVCNRQVHADTVSAAVAQVRYEFAGSGCIVLQASQFNKSVVVEPVTEAVSA